MHIIEKITVDRAGRLSLTKVFGKMPEKVVPSFDTKTKKLLFKEVAEGDNPKMVRIVDSKNRVCLPKWMTEKLGTDYYVCAESANEHAVLPCKFVFVG